jgi:hypothetical protein
MRLHSAGNNRRCRSGLFGMRIQDAGVYYKNVLQLSIKKQVAGHPWQKYA